MAKKKTEETQEAFDLHKALDALQCPSYFKAGLGYYIENQKKEIKSQKDFDKIVKEFSEITM